MLDPRIRHHRIIPQQKIIAKPPAAGSLIGRGNQNMLQLGVETREVSAKHERPVTARLCHTMSMLLRYVVYI